MEFILRDRTDIAISHRHMEIAIEIEDINNCLQSDLLEQIFEKSGIKYLENTLTEDMMTDLLDSRTEFLHDYLTKSGYIFNKN